MFDTVRVLAGQQAVLVRNPGTGSSMSASMMMVMPKERITVTLDPEVLELVQQYAGDMSVSAFVNDVLADFVRREGMRDLLRELDEEFGPVPDDVREKGEQIWREFLSSTRERSSGSPEETSSSEQSSLPPTGKTRSSSPRSSSQKPPEEKARATRRRTA